jgi:hypothetical protein
VIDYLFRETDLELFGAIDVENNTVNKGQRHTALVLEKAEKGWWSRLLKAEGDQAEASEADQRMGARDSMIADLLQQEQLEEAVECSISLLQRIVQPSVMPEELAVEGARTAFHGHHKEN